ncbi:hypothetical protein FRC04_010275 [Tulasnella sp. 424]|nr:hypothetical protein FRC04_010275 [Tulasnella sp. 424]KAG8972661.1 hypothetical protein FRC05_009672 [Tulasnella sp. 425]
MNATTHIFEQPLTELPDIPLQFGQDGGKFYHYYDQLADELDEDLTKRLKSQLDSLLIFAGLFAGVNSAFLALTLPMMSADPTDDTNALLLQLVKGGNTTINSQADLPSATFSPPSAIYPVNVLFAVSLTCALMSSFLAALGQKWLVYYRKRSGGGAEHQRNEQLRRQLGAQRWRLELVLDDILPSLLQRAMSTVVAAVVGTALAITVGAAVCATWDRMCPYQSPLSHLLCWAVDRMNPLVVAFVWGFIFLKTYFEDILRSGPQESNTISNQPWKNLKTKSWKSAQEITSRGLTRLSRKVETADGLKVALIKRVILTSEHPTALVYAATNLCAIDDHESLLQLLNDAESFDRLHDLFSTFCDAQDALPIQLRTMSEVAARALAAAIVHMALSVGSITDLVPPEYRPQTIEGFTGVMRPSASRVTRNAAFEGRVLNRDLKDVSGLRLMGDLLGSLLYSPNRTALTNLRYTAEALSESSTSHQSLCTLACAVKMSIEWDSGAMPGPGSFSPLFELAKTTYQG